MLSDAQQLALIGAIAAVTAIVAIVAERRRTRRACLDAVGFMPWTAMSMFALLVACVSFGLAARAWFAG